MEWTPENVMTLIFIVGGIGMAIAAIVITYLVTRKLADALAAGATVLQSQPATLDGIDVALPDEVEDVIRLPLPVVRQLAEQHDLDWLRALVDVWDRATDDAMEGEGASPDNFPPAG